MLVGRANGLACKTETFAEFARRQAKLDAHQRPRQRHKAASIEKPPPFFGSAARTEILIILAVNGPLHVRHIARLRNVDAKPTFYAVERLRTAGLVAKRDHSRRVVALNRANPTYPHLKAFLDVLAQRFPPPRIDVPTYRWGLPERDDPHVIIDENNIFGQAAKTRTLLAVAAAGPLNLTDVARATQSPHLTVWHAANSLQRLGLVISYRRGKERLLCLSTSLPLAPEFHTYLKAVIRNLYPEYDAVRALTCDRSAAY